MTSDSGNLAPCDLSRRKMLRAGGVGMLGLSLSGVRQQTTPAADHAASLRRPKRVVYIFLPGGAPQHETFDPKPHAPASIRGEFKAVATRTPGLFFSEHLPRLAQRSDKFALLRSLEHHSNDHIAGTTIMVSGDTRVPTLTPDGKEPDDHDTPGIAALAGYFRPGEGGLPGAAVVPEYVGRGTGTGRIAPGQTGGRLGRGHDPWLVQAASDCLGWGACPRCFDDGDDDAVFALGLEHRHSVPGPIFEAPSLSLRGGLTPDRLSKRLSLLERYAEGRRDLDARAEAGSHGRFRRQAASLLASDRVCRALDLKYENDKVLDAYGRNKFGWSLLLARRLLEVGVNMIQVSLGRNGTWDLHRRAFPLLKDYLLPPTDRAVAALLDDLEQRGMLEGTLVVTAGGFGRPPRISAPAGRRPGRDHWGPVQSVLLAGGGVTGGALVGSTDKLGGYPASTPKTPEDLAATIFAALGIDRDAIYHDRAGRVHPVYLGAPITELYT